MAQYDEIQIYPLSFGDTVEVRWLLNGQTADRAYLRSDSIVAGIRNRVLSERSVYLNDAQSGRPRYTIETDLVTLPPVALWNNDPHDLVHLLNAKPFFSRADDNTLKCVVSERTGTGNVTTNEHLLVVFRKMPVPIKELLYYAISQVQLLGATGNANIGMRVYRDIDLTSLSPSFTALPNSNSLERWQPTPVNLNALPGVSAVVSGARLLGAFNTSSALRVAGGQVDAGLISWRNKLETDPLNLAVTAYRIDGAGTAAVSEIVNISEYD